VHGQNIHHIIMAQTGLLQNTIPPPAVVYNVIAANKSCQIKGFGWSVEGRCTLAGIFTDGLAGDMLMAIQDEVRPDLV